MHVKMRLTLPRQPTSVTQARHLLATLLTFTDAPEDVRGHLGVLISEACANAVMHSDPGSDIDISVIIDEQECVLAVGNRGKTPGNTGFRTGLPGPLTVGGRGLPFIAALADSATFVDGQPGFVLLRIRKTLQR